MKTKTQRCLAAALMTGLFLPQSIGAADLAVMMGPAARPLMFPQPAQLAPRPQGAAPGKSWAQRFSEYARDVSTVAAWLTDARQEEKPVSAPVFAKRPVGELPLPAAPEAAPGFGLAEPALSGAGDPAQDRMLVAKSGEFNGVAPRFFIPEPRYFEARRPLYAPRLEMPWLTGRDVRFRIVYLNPPGVTWADAQGFHAKVLDRDIRAEVTVPQRYWRNFPLYFSRDRVSYEIEIENTSGKTLTGLTVTALQEAFNMAGGKGPGLLEPQTSLTLAPIKPGDRAVMVNTFSFSHSSHASINFEQTHLTIAQAGETLADEPQAGIADPPGE